MRVWLLLLGCLLGGCLQNPPSPGKRPLLVREYTGSAEPVIFLRKKKDLACLESYSQIPAGYNNTNMVLVAHTGNSDTVFETDCRYGISYASYQVASRNLALVLHHSGRQNLAGIGDDLELLVYNIVSGDTVLSETIHAGRGVIWLYAVDSSRVLLGRRMSGRNELLIGENACPGEQGLYQIDMGGNCQLLLAGDVHAARIIDSKNIIVVLAKEVKLLSSEVGEITLSRTGWLNSYGYAPNHFADLMIINEIQNADLWKGFHWTKKLVIYDKEVRQLITEMKSSTEVVGNQ